MVRVLEDIQLLDRSVVGCPDPKWIVVGRSVVALYPSLGQAAYTEIDRCLLGKPSADPSFRNNLRLWVGFEQAACYPNITCPADTHQKAPPLFPLPSGRIPQARCVPPDHLASFRSPCTQETCYRRRPKASRVSEVPAVTVGL